MEPIQRLLMARMADICIRYEAVPSRQSGPYEARKPLSLG